MSLVPVAPVDGARVWVWVQMHIDAPLSWYAAAPARLQRSGHDAYSLLMKMDAAGYRVFAKELNLLAPTCSEFSFILDS